jgi:hypothetical protein
MTAIDFDESRDLIVTVPRPGRHIRFAMFGLAAFIFLYIVLFVGSLYEFLTLPQSDRQTGVPRFVSNALIFAMIVGCMARGFIDWNRPLVISRIGIDLRGLRVTWGRIVSCRWNRYSSGTLVITMNHGEGQIRQYGSIPVAERPLVEKTLRDFGKWEN